MVACKMYHSSNLEMSLENYRALLVNQANIRIKTIVLCVYLLYSDFGYSNKAGTALPHRPAVTKAHYM